MSGSFSKSRKPSKSSIPSPSNYPWRIPTIPIPSSKPSIPIITKSRSKPSPSIPSKLTHGVYGSSKQNWRNDGPENSSSSYVPRKGTPSFGIWYWYDSKVNSSDDNIFKFTIPEQTDPDPSKHIKHDADYHNRFKKFFETAIIKKEGDLFDKNDGEIITSHPYDATDTKYKLDEEDKAYLEKLKGIYHDTYLSDKKMHSGVENNNGDEYPDYEKDLFNKSNLIYKQFEKDTGITKRIDRQNDEEFLGTLEQRIDGLEECLKDDTETEERKNYYMTQQENENATFTQFNNSDYTEIDRIKEQCKSIYWDDVTLNRKIDEFDFGKKFKDFLTDDDNLELKILKTFLPKDIFSDNIDTLIENIKTMLKSDDPQNRTFRQYIFGFGTDIKPKYYNYRPFLFEIQSMLGPLDSKYICDKFVNWTIMLNLLYDTCSISNTDVLFPCRFVIPIHQYTTFTDTSGAKGIKIRFIKKLYNLFFREKTKFIGIITIKNIKTTEQERREGTKKSITLEKKRKQLMMLFIFRNLDLTDSDRYDTLTGIIPDYFTVDASLRFHNEGAIISHPNVTRTELNHFMELSNNPKPQQKPKIRIFRSKLSENMIFFANTDYRNQTNNNTLDMELNSMKLKSDFYYDLGLEEIEINRVFPKEKSNTKENIEYFEFIPKTEKQSGGNIKDIKKDNNYNNIKIQTTTIESNLYKGNPLIAGYSYNNFLNKVDECINIDNTDKKTYAIKYILSTGYLYNYLLILHNEIYSNPNRYNIKDKNLVNIYNFT